MTNLYTNSQTSILEILCTETLFKVIHVSRSKVIQIIYFNIRTAIKGHYIYKYMTLLLHISVCIVHLQGGD
jgi:hypothetical protein